MFCEFNSESYSFPLKKPFSRSLSLRLFLWNLQSAIWNPIDGYGENGNILRWKPKRSFLKNSLCSVSSSHRVTAFPSRSRSLRLFLWNWQRDIWKPIVGYGEKGNIFRSKLERSFLRNCLCSVNSSQSVTAFPSRSLSLRLFLWNLKCDIWKPIERYGEK